VIVTVLVYRPDRPVPFDFLDFSEFLPLLQRGETFAGRLGEMLSYYAGERGRFNLLGYVGIVAKWELFGTSSPGWQYLRFATMWGMIALGYLLLRRVGHGRAASAAGAGVWLFSQPAIDGWTRLTMAEPLGTVLVLAGCLLALQPGGTRTAERRVGLAFAAICCSLVLLKEMMAVLLLLPIALVAILPGAAADSPGSTRVRTLLTATAISVLVAGIPVVMVAFSAPDDAYTAAFGRQWQSTADVLAQWTLGIVPFGPGSSFPPAVAGVALLALVGVLGVGWWLRLRAAGAARPAQRRLLLLAALLPAVGAVTYLPWPSPNRFYAIPFLIGGALLAAGALDALEARSRTAGIVAYGLWCVFLVFAAGDAAGQSNRLAARQLMNRAAVERLATLRDPRDTAYVATDQQVPTEWQGLSATLERYGRALGFDMPTLVTLRCADSRARAARGDVLIVAYHSHCPGLHAGDPIVYEYRRPDIGHLRIETDSLRVDFVNPGRPPSGLTQ
jgi:hypothetical protein